ncbi:MAG: deaminase [Minisyncoccia bacterium]
METKDIKYPYLPAGKTILYVPESNPFIIEAKKTAFEQATDRRYIAGVVIVLDGKVIGRGALHSGIKNKKLIELHQKGLCIRRMLKIKSGQKYWLCPGCAAPKNHSEPTAIRNAKKNGYNTNGADLYLWGHWWFCKDCWDAMISAGIKNVYLMADSENLFNLSSPKNIIGKQFK